MGPVIKRKRQLARGKKKDFSGGQDTFSRAVEERGKVAGIEEE